jgi:acyl carrier protein
MAEIVDTTIITYLRGRFPALEAVNEETPLLSSGAVDSLGILDLMMFLADEFGIALEDDDFTPDNLETPGRLAALVVRKQAA